MPNSSPFIVRLKSILPEETWPWVIPALRKGQLVWESLDNAEFSEQALVQIGDNPQGWTPGALALVSLGLGPDAKLGALDPDLRQEAIRSYEELAANPAGAPVGPIDLSQAGLMAIAFSERHRQTGSWGGLLDDLQKLPQSTAESCVACLYGLVDEKTGLLQALMSPGTPQETQSLALHAILSTPTPVAEHARTLHPPLRALPQADCLSALIYLKRFRPRFATQLARLFLEKQPTIPNRRKYSDFAGYLKQITHLLRNAEIHLIAELPSQALSLRFLAMQVTKRLHADIALQIAGSRAGKGDLDAAKSMWQDSEDMHLAEPAGPILPPPIELVLALVKKGHFEDALTLLDDQSSADAPTAGPLRPLILASRLASQKELNAARTKAQKALDQVEEGVTAWNRTQKENPLDDARSELLVIEQLAQLLLDLALPREAIRAYDLVLARKPDHPELLKMKAIAQRLTGDASAAVATSHLAVAVDPGRADLRRELIGSLESAGAWESALEERTVFLQERFKEANQNLWPPVKDLQALAICALQAGQPQRSAAVCRQLLELDPGDGQALATLGEALATMDELEQGLEHLQKATQLAPHLSLPWIALARVRVQAGESAKAIETLRAACNAAPSDPQIFFALAQAYLEEDSHTQALASLRRAYQIISNASPGFALRDQALFVRIAMSLGLTLTLLGHLEEARQVLESAYLEHPSFPGLAYSYARSLLSLGQPGLALEPLRTAVQGEQTKPGVFLDYARAILAVNEGAGEAVGALRTAILLAEKSDPSLRADAQGLLAEALAANGELNAALQAYYQALETELASDPDWRGRLSLGLGLVTLQLNQFEIAVASLQEASRLDPHNPLVHQKLAEAYAATQLPEEALNSARMARDLAHDDVNVLAWFAGQALELNAPEEAAAALSGAIHLDPQRTDLAIRLGQIYSQLGKTDLALDVLRTVPDAQNPTFQEFYLAAQLLLDLGDAPAAATCLERAKALSPDPDPALLQYLAISYHESGEIQRGLETLDYALDLDPGNLSPYILKADLLGSAGEPQAAQNTLQHALELFPDNPDLHLRIAQYFRSNGQIAAALDSAERAVMAYQDAPPAPQALGARALAAGLAQALLKIDHARDLLSVANSLSEPQPDPDQQAVPAEGAVSEPNRDWGRSGSDSYLAFYCLSSEMALDQGEEIAAAEALTRAFEASPDHPRVAALQARLTRRRGDQAAGVQILQTALEALGQDGQVGPISQTGMTGRANQAEVCTAVAAAAVEFQHWDVALYLLRRAATLAPQEAFPHLQIARTLVVRAEYQRLCESLEAIAHAPGSSVCSESAYHSFDEALLNAAQCLPEDQGDEPKQGRLLIARWGARGQAVFQPNRESLRALEELPNQGVEDYAAMIALLRQIGDLVAIANIYRESVEGRKRLPRDHRILAQFALSLGYNGRRQNDLSESIDAARAALDQQPGQPLYHILLGLLIDRNGDPDTALRSIQTGISIWPSEPRWHAMAARFHLENGDAPPAIVHLKRATQLEPQHPPHYLALGQASLEHGDPDQAIQAFEQAQRLDPRDIDVYLSLAQAYLRQGDLKKAANCADSATRLAPDQTGPLLLRAEIALQAGDSQGALRRSQAALEINPQDVSALHLQARCLNRLGQATEALKVLDQALTLTPDPLPWILERVDLVASSLGPQAALAELQDLAVRYPGEPSVLAPLSVALAEAGMQSEAIGTAQYALRGESLQEDQKGRLHLLLGRLLRGAGQLDQAIYQLNEAIRLAPENVDTYLELGAAHQDRRQYSAALESYQQAIDLSSGDPRPYYQAGLMLKEDHDYQRAEDMLRQAANLAHDDPNIHRQLAAIVALNLVHNRRRIPIDL